VCTLFENNSIHMTSLLALKASSLSRNLKEQATSDLHRDCLVLVHSFLKEQGFHNVSCLLEMHAGTVLNGSEKCDNIDLKKILSDFKTFYEMKHGKQPVYSRRRNPKNSSRQEALHCEGRHGHHAGNLKRKTLLPSRLDDQQEALSTLEVSGNKNEPKLNQKTVEREGSLTADRIIKPVPKFDDAELQILAASLQREILQDSPNIKWDDIVGLDNAKRILKEAVVMPIKFPELFTGPLLEPWRGALLFGVPGTGKTLLAKAVATETNTAFFNITSSSITSKFRGDSEKMIRVLFKLARYHAPSTIFFDEIDALLGQRGSGSSSSGVERIEHEGSRRMKSELLIEMDGLGKDDASKQVFVLGSTNLPWDLDCALLRRLEKRIIIAPPCDTARKAMLEKHLLHHKHNLTVDDLQKVSSLTEHFTGADIKLLCKEAAMVPVRTILEQLEETNVNDCHSSNQRSCQKTNIQVLLKRHPITIDIFMTSLEKTMPSIDAKDSIRYEQWAKKHGSI